MSQESSSNLPELREYSRFEFNGRAILSGAGTHGLPSGALVDLSLGGCLIRLPQAADLEPGEMVDVTLQSNYLSMRTRGSVRRCSDAGHLIGIAFESLTARARADILLQLADLESVMSTQGAQ